jgi:hypothetical protein
LTTKQSFFRLAAPFAMAAIVVSACTGGGATQSPSSSAAAPSTGGGASAPASGATGSQAAGGNMDKLIADAKAEGGLTTIALPHSWCNYGELITGFTAKYGIPINELNPDAGYVDEV